MSEPDRPTGGTGNADRTGPQSRGSAGPDAAGHTDARVDDGPHPSEGPADGAGPTVDAGDRPAVPATVATAPSIRGASSAQAADTGAAQGGSTGDRDDLQRPS